MGDTFSSPCCRCGFCCLVQVCPVGLSIFGGEKNRRCPALRWRGDEASCGLIDAMPTEEGKKGAGLAIGVGVGCCISARAVSLFGGEAVDFATQFDSVKVEQARMLRDRRGVTVLRLRRSEPAGATGGTQ